FFLFSASSNRWPGEREAKAPTPSPQLPRPQFFPPRQSEKQAQRRGVNQSTSGSALRILLKRKKLDWTSLNAALVPLSPMIYHVTPTPRPLLPLLASMVLLLESDARATCLTVRMRIVQLT